MVSSSRSPKKIAYFEKFNRLVESYSKILIVRVEHIGSRQMAEIRLALRGKAVILMGKNTMIRTALEGLSSRITSLKALIPRIRQQIGLIFCIEDPADVRQIVLENKVPAPARQGAVAPVNVVVRAGPTSLDPSQTSFFQALGIPTKLVKSQIEIQADVNLISVGDKVSASQSALLKKLNILPFTYGLVVLEVYDDGCVYDASLLDMTKDDVTQAFSSAAKNIAAFSLQIGMPNQISIPYTIAEGFKNCIALAINMEDFVFPELEHVKKVIENPELYASKVDEFPTNASGAVQSEPEESKKQEQEPEEDEEEDFGFDIFG